MASSPFFEAPLRERDREEPSGVRRSFHLGERAVDEGRFEHGATLRGLVVRALMQDAGFDELVSIHELNRDARVEYPEALRTELFAQYEAWMAPVFYVFSEAFRRNAEAGTLDPREAEAARLRMESEIGNALHCELRDIRHREDRWKDVGEMPNSPFYLLGAHVMALRAMLRRRNDWLPRVDELARGFMRRPDTGEAWERAAAAPDWVPSLNRALGLAGISADFMIKPQREERHLFLDGDALVPAEEGAGSLVADECHSAREEGAALRRALELHAERETAPVHALAKLQRALKKYVENLGSTDAFDLPNVLQWKEEIRTVSRRILEIHGRQTELASLREKELARDPDVSTKAIETSHAHLDEQKRLLITRLSKVRSGYELIGKQLEALAEQGVVFSPSRPVALSGLLALVEERLRQADPRRPETYAK